MRSYFQLFDLPQRYLLDLGQLERNYRTLQASMHPDRFVGDGAQARRLAEQYSGLLNQAYTTLRCPVERAAHLLQLLGVEIDAASTISDGDFLFRQMTLRERLHGARQQCDEAALLQLKQEALAEQSGLKQAFSQVVEESKELESALQILLKMRFLKKFLSDIHDAEDALLD